MLITSGSQRFKGFCMKLVTHACSRTNRNLVAYNEAPSCLFQKVAFWSQKRKKKRKIHGRTLHVASLAFVHLFI